MTNKEKIILLEKYKKLLLEAKTIIPKEETKNNSNEKVKVKVLTKKYYGKDLRVG